jgi:hypothetical protein
VQAAAVAAACREATIRAGLDWLCADGQIQTAGQDSDAILLEPLGTSDPAAKERAMARLRALLDETRAYRAFWMNRVTWP